MPWMSDFGLTQLLQASLRAANLSTMLLLPTTLLLLTMLLSSDTTSSAAACVKLSKFPLVRGLHCIYAQTA